jgi:Uma2 family endonuclease
VSDPAKKRATYQDVLDAPDHLIAEIINGDLRLSPRPGAPHTVAQSGLGALLAGPMQFGTNGGPGGWMILFEPELHLGEDIVVPDVAGWRVERMPQIHDDLALHDAYFTIAPDWVCEVLSRRTAVDDRLEKLPIYAAAQVGHAWLVDAAKRSLEVFRLHADTWLVAGVYTGNQTVRAEPFDAIELDLSALWSYLPRPKSRSSRASEANPDYQFEYAFELDRT